MKLVRGKQLGINASTARHHMIKSFVFHLSKQLGLDACLRCGRRIKTVDDMTYDHKKPWLHSKSPKKLYLDPANIALSHPSCNMNDRRQNFEFNSKAGYKGVTFDCTPKRRAQPWVAIVLVKGRRKFLGRYKTPRAAAKAYDLSASKLLGKYAVTNRMLKLL